MSPSSLTSILPSPPESERKRPRLLTPSTNAIPLISAENGTKYSLLHTVAVLVLFVVQFRALVADPYRTMMLDLIPLALLQCGYCIACLPPTGTWHSTTSESGSQTAGSSSVKPSKASGTGSLRKRPAGLGRTGNPGSGRWKAKALVYTLPLVAMGQVD